MRDAGTMDAVDLERRIRRRGLPWAMLRVEDDNPPARTLYERLGYTPCRHETAAWQSEDAQGALFHYETEVTVLGKRL